MEACPAHVHDTSETCPIGGGREYRIKWRGWGSRWNTWEPERHIIDQVILTEWEETKARRAASAARSSTPAPRTDERDQALLAEYRDKWLARYAQAAVARHASVSPGQLSAWLKGTIGQRAVAGVELKLRAGAGGLSFCGPSGVFLLFRRRAQAARLGGGGARTTRLRC